MSQAIFVSPYPKAVLALADGSLFSGFSLGSNGYTVGEVVFNTAMTGYQEIMTDPSYARQMVVMTYPHIGNVGINADDTESSQAWLAGLIIRENSPVVSNWRAQHSLHEYLLQQNTVAICGVDTRRLTRHLRDHGAQNGCIFVGDDAAKALQLAQGFDGIDGKDLAKEVTCKTAYEWQRASYSFSGQEKIAGLGSYHVVVYDFGVKQQILRMLVDRGCRVTVVPAQTSADDVLAMQPDGVFLSNGPGDPAACDYAISNTRIFLDNGVPLFGICLGFQIMALACHAKTIKMKFGHHGANHPVQDCRDSSIMITSQNHSFCVDRDSLPDELEMTHVSLFDDTLQGFRHKLKPALAMQGHPEASPGPQDMADIFDEFINLIQIKQGVHAKTN